MLTHCRYLFINQIIFYEKNYYLCATYAYCCIVLCSSIGLFAQTVLYPAQEKAGIARIETGDNNWVLSNDLFSAEYAKENGKLVFKGCDLLDLVQSDELFYLTLGDGTVISSNDMTLGDITVETLTANPEATRGVERFDGKQLKAVYTHGNITVNWYAVLRNDSHYLRTYLEITSSVDQAMTSITPMLYTVKNDNGVPESPGNTWGSMLKTKTIFAGLESPMGLNSLVGADVNNFSLNSWTPESFVPQSSVPTGILSLSASFSTNNIVATVGNVTVADAGSATITFTYGSGTHRLNIVGVDLVSADGNVVAQDYHIGYTGNEYSKNSYTLNVPEDGDYSIRFWMETATETITSSGAISYSGVSIAKRVDVATENVSNIQGLWRRPTTLYTGKVWTIGTVVGYIPQDSKQDQSRRSVLAYVERERAVPWRSHTLYNSWYELNIDRNNANPPTGNMNIGQCVEVVEQWKTNLYDKYNVSIESFVWDDGWDEYGTWTFHDGFPNGLKETVEVCSAMGSGQGAWLGPVGGYGVSGDLRRKYWTDRGGQMLLSYEPYRKVFMDACESLVKNYDFRFFKLDGLSAIGDATGPDLSKGTNGADGIESIEQFIEMNKSVREIRPDIYINATVGTWASPFWYHFADATWRQQADWAAVSSTADNGDDRERWITYRDNLVHEKYVTNSPLCPINNLMTHGLIVTSKGDVSKTFDYNGIVREMRCAFACGSGMVELYVDFAKFNEINNGALWSDLADCIKWHKSKADVMADVHWVGGDPWDGSNVNVYGWAAWNEEKSVLTLRNPSTNAKSFTFTLRDALEIPEYVTGEITLTPAFEQVEISGLTNAKVHVDKTITVTLPGSTVVVFDGVNDNSGESLPEGPQAVTSLADIDNGSVYTIQSLGRGPIFTDATVKEGAGDYVVSNSYDNVTDNVAPGETDNYRFALLRGTDTTSGQYYLYSLATKKFVELEDTKLKLASAPSTTFTIEAATGDYASYWAIRTGDNEVNVSGWDGNYGIRVDNANLDEGNVFIITDVADADLSDALAMISAVENGEELPVFPISFNITATKSERLLDGISLTGSVSGTQSKTFSSNTNVYYNLTEEMEFTVKAGETLTFTPANNEAKPIIWMHSYVYIDLDNNGVIDVADIDDLELVAYSFFSADDSDYGYNSAGDSKESNVGIDQIPSFTAPNDAGTYYMRYKIDWNNVQPEGNPGPKNFILNNNGNIVDLKLVVEAYETGIDYVEPSQVEDGKIYDLSGRRVEKPSKGLYIVNGKKVYIK